MYMYIHTCTNAYPPTHPHTYTVHTHCIHTCIHTIHADMQTCISMYTFLCQLPSYFVGIRSWSCRCKWASLLETNSKTGRLTCQSDLRSAIFVCWWRTVTRCVDDGHCNTLQHTATHCNTLQHTATHTPGGACPALQHTASHCHTLQHTATHTPGGACAMLAHATGGRECTLVRVVIMCTLSLSSFNTSIVVC